MRIHALEASGGLTYAQMGRFLAAKDPTNPAGTSDEAAALKDADGNPVANAARNTWVTETALTTALNVSYMAEQIALFGLIVGIALLLSGIGFVILALIVLGAGQQDEARLKRRAARADTKHGAPAPQLKPVLQPHPGQAAGTSRTDAPPPGARRGGESRPFSVPAAPSRARRTAPESQRRRRASARRDRAGAAVNGGSSNRSIA